MFKWLIPDQKITSLDQCDLTYWKAKGIQLIVVDFDQTLVDPKTHQVSEKVIQWLNRCQQVGIQVQVASNNHPHVLKDTCESLKLKYQGHAKKPFPFIYWKLLKEYDRDQILCIGDQLLSDILGAHLMKIKAIYCEPVSHKDLIYTKLNRKLEAFIFKKMEKNK